jgi:hypothetical protein
MIAAVFLLLYTAVPNADFITIHCAQHSSFRIVGCEYTNMGCLQWRMCSSTQVFFYIFLCIIWLL